MKDFENIGKKLPYSESQEYLDTLIAQTTEAAISQSGRSKTTARQLPRLAIAAAIACLLAFTGITLLQPTAEQQTAQTESASPIDQFLNDLTDEEVQLLAYYDIEEIPEYQ